MMLGIGIYVLSNNFWFFILAETVLGLAGALRSGTDSAILYDHLKSIDDHHRYMKHEGTAEFWSRTGTAVSSIAGGLFGAYATLRLPFYVNLFSAFLMLLVGLSLKEPPREKRPEGNPIKNIMNIAVTSIKHKFLFSTMIQMGVIFSTGVTGIWGYFLLYRQLEIPLIWHGFIFAAMQLVCAFGARHGSQIEAFIGKKFTSGLLLIPGICFLVIGTTNHLLIVISFVMLNAVLWGISTPIMLEKVQRHTTSDVRATTLSVGSMVGRVVTISIGPLFGLIVDHSSIGIAFVTMGLFFYVANFGLLFYKRGN